MQFEVAEPFFWVDCADDVTLDSHWYNPENGEFVAYPPQVITQPSQSQPTIGGAQTL